MALDLASFTSALRSVVAATPRLDESRMAVLTAELHFEAGGPEVALAVSVAEPGQAGTARSWRRPYPSGRTGGDPLDLTVILPDEGLAELRSILDASLPDHDLPLWLDLKRPYGFLGAAPWDDRLAAALDRPVFRLPDLLQPPRENTDVFEAAILFDPHPEIASEFAIAQAIACADAVHAASTRLQTRVHLFASGRWATTLAAAAFKGPTEVHTHAGAPSAATSAARSARRSNPWTDWIGDALRGRSLDALLFICRASSDALGATLLLSGDPFAIDTPVPLLPADAEEVAAMLTRLGSWAALFAVPAGLDARGAVAFMADAVARVRPGPVLFAGPDADRDRLTGAFRVLLSSGGVSLPRGFGGFLYCYPSAVQHTRFAAGTVLDAIVASTQLVAQRSPLTDRVLTQITRMVPALTARTLSQAPNWASAAQRYLETAQLDQLRRIGSDVLLSAGRRWTGAEPTADGQAEPDITTQTLATIKDIIGDYMRGPGRSDGT